MSIKKETIPAVDQSVSYRLVIDNGDLQAIKDVMDKYRFLDEEALGRFALYVLLKAEKNTVYIDEGDKKIALSPADRLVKPQEQHG